MIQDVCIHTYLITSASAYASFKGMLVNNSSSENLNCKPNMSHTVLSTPKQFQRSKPANKWKIMSLEKKLKGARFFGYLYFLLVCIFCAPKLELNTFFCTKGRSRAWWFRGTPILGNFHVYIYIYILYIYIYSILIGVIEQRVKHHLRARDDMYSSHFCSKYVAISSFHQLKWKRFLNITARFWYIYIYTMPTSD